MRSRIEKDRYLILPDDDMHSTSLDKNTVDETFATLERAVIGLNEALLDIYKHSPYSLYELLHDEVFSAACFELDEGRNWKLQCLLDELQDLMRKLATQDDEEVMPPEYYVTLQDIGFERDIVEKNFFQKEIDVSPLSGGKKVVKVEEVILNDDGAYQHRMRTIVYRIAPGVQSSESIKYEDAPTSAELHQAVNNTLRLRKEGVDV